jgi:hypothetical protein
MQYDSQFGGPSIRLKIQESDGHSNNIKALIFQKSVRQGHSHRRTWWGWWLVDGKDQDEEPLDTGEWRNAAGVGDFEHRWHIDQPDRRHLQFSSVHAGSSPNMPFEDDRSRAPGKSFPTVEKMKPLTSWPVDKELIKIRDNI